MSLLRRVRDALIAVAATLTLLVVVAPRHVYACSAGPDWNPIIVADVIIAGFATDVRLTALTESRYAIATVTFDVDRYLKGSGPAVLNVIDTNSVYPHSIPADVQTDADLALLDIDDAMFEGSDGTCGALTGDPRGRYWVVGMTRTDDGRLRMGELLNLAIGSGPDDPVVLERIALVEQTLDELASSPIPASTGNGGLGRVAGSPHADAAAAGAAILAMALIATARLRVR